VWIEKFGEESVEAASTAAQLGFCLFQIEQFELALPAFESSLKIYAKHLPDGKPSRSFAFMKLNVAYLHGSMGDTDKSIAMFNDILPMYEQVKKMSQSFGLFL
jgi:tetratricopeptide (TPR) repeat protein